MRKKLQLKKASALVFLLLTAGNIHAQNDPGYSDDWYLGFGTGFQYSTMKFSDLDKDKYPSSEGHFSPLYSIFLQKEFGKEHSFLIRPQMSYLQRGGKLTEIGKEDAYPQGIEDVNYQLKAHFLDVRLPIIYQFGKAASGVRPYIGVTPLAGFALGGNIRLQSEGDKSANYAIAGYDIDLNSHNFNSTYFAVAPTLGLRFNFRTGQKAQNVLFVNLEASYEIGLTNTYSNKEQDGQSFDVLTSTNSYKFDGTRKFQGLNLQAMIGIPFSAFKKSKTQAVTHYVPAPQPVAMEQPKPKPVKKEKPCYTLDEINNLIAKGESVKGKTICAISDINFDFAKSTIQKRSYPYLNKLAQTIINTRANIEVKGHTDNVGSDEVNMKLSKQRAEAVMNYLIKQGVDKKKISYSYYGSSQPLTSNSTEEGRTMNRRVEFEILK